MNQREELGADVSEVEDLDDKIAEIKTGPGPSDYQPPKIVEDLRRNFDELEALIQAAASQCSRAESAIQLMSEALIEDEILDRDGLTELVDLAFDAIIAVRRTLHLTDQGEVSMNQRELGTKVMHAVLANRSVIAADNPQEAIERVLVILDGEIAFRLSRIEPARRLLEKGENWKAIAAQCDVNRERFGGVEASVSALRDLRYTISNALLVPRLESERVLGIGADE